MASPSQLAAARKAGDRLARTRKLADVMHERASVSGACQMQDLRAAGFTEAEIFAYSDDARAILSGRPDAGRLPVRQGRKEGTALVKEAQRIRKRMAQRQGASA